MTGQRTDIEVVRDCLRILDETQKLREIELLTERDAAAIHILVTENLEAILQAAYRKLDREVDNQTKKLVALVSELSEESSAT